MNRASRSQPWPSSWTVRRARDAYLEENGFTIEAYDAKWTDASFLGIKFAVPNTRAHRIAIMQHDLHHVATGFGTDLVGEGELSAWELRGLSGLGVYVASLVVMGTFAGFALSPRRALAALRAGGTTLFDARAGYDALLNLTVGELRARLGVPEHGLATAARGVHAYAPVDTDEVTTNESGASASD